MLGFGAGGEEALGSEDAALDDFGGAVRDARALWSLVEGVSLRRLLEVGFVVNVDGVQRRPWTSWVTVGPRFQDFTSSLLPGMPSGPEETAPMIWSAG